MLVQEMGSASLISKLSIDIGNNCESRGVKHEEDLKCCEYWTSNNTLR